MTTTTLQFDLNTYFNLPTFNNVRLTDEVIAKLDDVQKQLLDTISQSTKKNLYLSSFMFLSKGDTTFKFNSFGNKNLLIPFIEDSALIHYFELSRYEDPSFTIGNVENLLPTGTIHTFRNDYNLMSVKNDKLSFRYFFIVVETDSIMGEGQFRTNIDASDVMVSINFPELNDSKFLAHIPGVDVNSSADSIKRAMSNMDQFLAQKESFLNFNNSFKKNVLEIHGMLSGAGNSFDDITVYNNETILLFHKWGAVESDEEQKAIDFFIKENNMFVRVYVKQLPDNFFACHRTPVETRVIDGETYLITTIRFDSDQIQYLRKDTEYLVDFNFKHSYTRFECPITLEFTYRG